MSEHPDAAGALPPSPFGAGYSVGPSVNATPSVPAYAPPNPAYPVPAVPTVDDGLRYPAPTQPPLPPPMVVPTYPVGPPMYYVARRTNSMAIAALVCSLVFAPLGIVFGHIALSQLKHTGEDGHGLAIAGLVIGYLFTGLILLYLFLVGAVFAAIVGH